MLRPLIISNCAPHDYYLIQQVSTRWPLCGLVRPTWFPRKAQPGSRLKSFLRHPAASVYERIRDRYYYYFFRRQNREVSRLLYGTIGIPQPANVIALPSREINSQETAERICALRPDVLIVSGGPVLKPRIYSIPNLAAINVHYGIAPDYRGEHTLFWALRRRDFDKIGVSLHYISEGIDTGRLLARGFPDLDPDDTQSSLWVKFARLAAEMVIDFLAAVEKHPGQLPQGQDQERESGIFVRSRDRKIWHDLEYGLKRRFKNYRIPKRAGRIERYY